MNESFAASLLSRTCLSSYLIFVGDKEHARWRFQVSADGYVHNHGAHVLILLHSVILAKKRTKINLVSYCVSNCASIKIESVKRWLRKLPGLNWSNEFSV